MRIRKRLQIYWPFALNTLKQDLAYKGAFYLFIFADIFGVFISYFLWMAIYGSSGSGILGGLTQNEMIVYIFMVHITANIVQIPISKLVSQDVVKGSVAMNLIRPINYRMSLVFRAFGNMIYQFIAPGIFIWIGLEIFKVQVLHIGLTEPIQILLYIISAIMSFLIYVFFDFCFGMLAFVTTYIFGMQMAKDALLSFFSGQLIPLAFFPAIMQKIFDFLPFSSMIYTPVMIYLGKYEGMMLMIVLARQAFWVVLLYILGSLLWRYITNRLVVLGG